MSDQTNTITASNKKTTEKALARSEIYLLLARSFAYPKKPLDEFYRRAIAAAVVLGDGFPEQLSQLKLPSVAQMETFYINAFGHTTPKDCPPYETEYGQSHFFMQAHALADIATFYKAFGVQGSSGERLDHLSTELEFMYVLTYKEAYALMLSKQEWADISRAGQCSFIEKHLGRWSLPFLQRLEQRTNEFYRQLARITAFWLNMEAKELGVSLSPFGEDTLSTSEENNSLFSCLECESDQCEERQ